MTLSTLTTTPISGSGEVMLAATTNEIAFTFTQIPVWMGSDRQPEPSYFPWLARISLGNHDGHLMAVNLRHADELVLLPAGVDRFAYVLNDGVQATVTEIKGPASAGGTSSTTTSAVSFKPNLLLMGM